MSKTRQALKSIELAIAGLCINCKQPREPQSWRGADANRCRSCAEENRTRARERYRRNAGWYDTAQEGARNPHYAPGIQDTRPAALH